MISHSLICSLHLYTDPRAIVPLFMITLSCKRMSNPSCSDAESFHREKRRRSYLKLVEFHKQWREKTELEHRASVAFRSQDPTDKDKWNAFCGVIREKYSSEPREYECEISQMAKKIEWFDCLIRVMEGITDFRDEIISIISSCTCEGSVLAENCGKDRRVFEKCRLKAIESISQEVKDRVWDVFDRAHKMLEKSDHVQKIDARAIASGPLESAEMKNDSSSGEEKQIPANDLIYQHSLKLSKYRYANSDEALKIEWNNTYEAWRAKFLDENSASCAREFCSENSNENEKIHEKWAHGLDGFEYSDFGKIEWADCLIRSRESFLSIHDQADVYLFMSLSNLAHRKEITGNGEALFEDDSHYFDQVPLEIRRQVWEIITQARIILDERKSHYSELFQGLSSLRDLSISS